MGTVGGLLGVSGGAGGTGFAAPSAAPIVTAVTQPQIQNAYAGVQGSMGGQDALLQALQAQQGIQNQSNVYNQMQDVAAGRGPNPAQAMLNQATGANVANQAAMMAGQRGASSNVGLMARQAANQGSNIQQQAAGQAATMQANQSLNAMNAAGNMASQQVGNQIGQTNANVQAQQSAQNALLNAQSGYNNAVTGSQSSVNAGNTSMANTQMAGATNLIGGAMNSGAKMMGGMMMGAEGGAVPHMDMGGEPSAYPGVSKFGQFVMTGAPPPPPIMAAAIQPGDTSKAAGDQSGGYEATKPDKAMETGAPMSYAGPDIEEATPQAGMEPGEMLAAKGGMADFRTGGKVFAKNQSQKAQKSGNSYSNDKIPAVLSEHEIVIPRNVTMGKDPVNGAAQFVAKVLAKRKGR